uniref:Uncharacterized protein n=1 Tax=Cannabis sativa TaxID=3483 RepID=A0A803QQ70_CANSA
MRLTGLGGTCTEGSRVRNWEWKFGLDWSFLFSCLLSGYPSGGSLHPSECELLLSFVSVPVVSILCGQDNIFPECLLTPRVPDVGAEDLGQVEVIKRLILQDQLGPPTVNCHDQVSHVQVFLPVTSKHLRVVQEKLGGGDTLHGGNPDPVRQQVWALKNFEPGGEEKFVTILLYILLEVKGYQGSIS